MAKKRNQHDDNLTRLATILRDALTAAWVKHNPDHTSPDFTAVKHLGRVGYRHVAEELLRRGIRPPVGGTAEVEAIEDDGDADTAPAT